MFAPVRSKKGGNLPLSIRREMLRQLVAAAVSILMDAGNHVTENDANRFVQARLAELGTNIAAGTVGKWRGEVMAALPRGVGIPRMPDKVWPAPTAEEDPDHDLYRIWWCSWRKWRQKGNSASTAKCFVARGVCPEMKHHIDPS
jgi:hypothetical protein